MLAEELRHERGAPLDERRLDDHLVESGRVPGPQTSRVGVIRVADDRCVRPRCRHVRGLDTRDIAEHEIGRIGAVGHDEVMPHEQTLQLGAKEEVDPDQQDRRHVRHATTTPPRRNTAAMTLQQGLDLIAEREYYAAHDALEEEWRDAPGPERNFLQGLIHVTVAWHHAGNGNAAGAGRQLEKAARRLDAYRPAHRGVDVDVVLGQVEAAAARIAIGRLDLLPVRVAGAPLR